MTNDPARVPPPRRAWGEADGLDHAGEVAQLLLQLRTNYQQCGAFQTMPPPGFEMPSEEAMHAALAAEGLAASRGFVCDLIQRAAGGTMIPPILWDDFIKREAAASGCKEGTVQKHFSARAELLRDVDSEALPGDTPLDKAVQYLRQLVKKGGGAGPGLGLVAAAAEPQQEPGTPQSFIGSPPHDDHLFQELAAPRERRGRHPGLHDGRAVLTDFLSDEFLQHVREVARLLRSKSALKSQALVIEQDNRASTIARTRPITSVNEVPLVQGSDWAMYRSVPGLFFYRAVSGGMPVSIPRKEEKPAARSIHKQLLYLLIDCSQSMANGAGRRIGTAAAVLLNRLAAVQQGQAELYYTFFDENAYEERHVKTPADAEAAIAEVRSHNFSGGSTNIKGALHHAARRVRTLGGENGGIRPEIMIVTDGGHDFSIKPELFEGTVLHSILCEGKNDSLAFLSEETGGVYLRI